jgi:hypothetical protein
MAAVLIGPHHLNNNNNNNNNNNWWRRYITHLKGINGPFLYALWQEKP